MKDEYLIIWLKLKSCHKKYENKCADVLVMWNITTQ